MYASVVELKVWPADVEEMIRVYRDHVAPDVERQPGFKEALLLTDRWAGTGMSIVLWETEEERQAGEFSEFHQEQISHFADLFNETPVRKHYEVTVALK
ncbi:MAG: antibiotic biosynthesis monooxygenase family protein [Rubrobacteraceae bacterium]